MIYSQGYSMLTRRLGNTRFQQAFVGDVDGHLQDLLQFEANGGESRKSATHTVFRYVEQDVDIALGSRCAFCDRSVQPRIACTVSSEHTANVGLVLPNTL